MELTPLNTDAIEAAAFMVRGKDIFNPRGQKFIPIGMNCTARPLGASSEGWYSTNVTYANGYSAMYSSTGTVLVDEWKYNPLPPVRLFDMSALEQGEHEFQIAGSGGVPFGAGSVVLSVSITDTIVDTSIFVYPSGIDIPTTPTFTVGTNKSMTRTVFAPLNEDGAVSIYVDAEGTNITLDVIGWIPVGYGITYLTPARLLDTRADGVTHDSQYVGTGKYQPGETRNLIVAGRGAVPVADAGAIVLNVTTLNATLDSHINLWPSGETQPTITQLRTIAGEMASDLVILKSGFENQISIYNESGYVDIIVDVIGYFRSDNSGYTPMTPARFMDTRVGYDTSDYLDAGTGIMSAEETRSFQIGGRLGVPFGIRAVMANVTAINQMGDGSVIAWSQGSTPEASVLTWNGTSATSNVTVIPVDIYGNTYIQSSVGTDLIIDVIGWLPSGQAGWGCNFLRLNAYDPGVGQTSVDVIQGIYALADEYLEKDIVVCLSNQSYIADITNPKNVDGQPSYEELYADDFFVELFEGWINRYKNSPYAWLNPLSGPWRDNNLSGWAATGTALYHKALSLGWTGVFVWDLPQWAYRLDLVASSTICEDFLKDKNNVVLGWHVYNFGSYTDKTLWIQTANAKNIPVIVTEVGSRVYYTPDQAAVKLAEEDSVQWCSDNAIPYGIGFVAWSGTGSISNPYTLAGELGTPFYSVKNTLSDDIESKPPLSPLGYALRIVSHNHKLNNPVYI